MHSDAASPSPEKAVLYVEDVAAKLGRSEAAIRHAIARQDWWLPKPFRMGMRWAWLPGDVEAHLAMLADRAVPVRKKGRPRKAGK